MKDARLIISKDPVIHKIPTVIGESGLRYDARKPSSQKNKLSSRLDSVRKTQSKISSPAKIKTEYKAFNKLSIKQLRDIVGRSHRTADLKGYDKSLAVSTILRDKFGDKAVKQAFGLKEEEVELDERLKFEGKFKKGDTIKSFDHRSSEKYYIIGILI